MSGSIFLKRKKVYCYAPFNNLLIDQQGQFRICCHNKTYTLGRYPEDTPEEIWFGKKRKEITQQFIKGEIPHSCYSCIHNGLNSSSPDSKMRQAAKYNETSFSHYPAQIEFLLDNTCNLNCVMCATNISSSSTADYVINGTQAEFSDVFIEQIKPFLKKGRYFVFSGGEPFLIPLYFTLWELISELNPNAGIYVQTNGTVLNDSIKAALKKHKIQMGVSIDSIVPETYEKIRKNASYQKTFDNLTYFIRHTESINKTLTMMTVPMTHNAYEIPSIVEFCNIRRIYFTISILERPIHLALWTWSSEELKTLLEAYKNYTFKCAPEDSVVKKNMHSFVCFKELIEKYLQVKTENESRENAFKKAITEKGLSIKNNFLPMIQDVLSKLTTDKSLSEELTTRFLRLITKMEKKYIASFNNDYPLHAIFIVIEPDRVLRLMLDHDDTDMEKTASAHIEEFCLLMHTKSYDRIMNLHNLCL